ncbi:hypothetical protein GOV14_06095 [Candidatus Pacearchaeota archaeon]|nr:hypothetical protein [Candidatus Pacearchaeota archaeon]
MIDDMCISCSEPITNPICYRCFLKQIHLWLYDKNFEKDVINEILREVRKEVFVDSLSETCCILCDDEYVAVCSYCVFFRAANVLKRFGVNNELLEDFLEIFNYQLGHASYHL